MNYSTQIHYGKTQHKTTQHKTTQHNTTQQPQHNNHKEKIR
jgi:hypothetical protein